MLRKIGLSLAAVAALVVGSAALPSEASAHGPHGGGGWHGGGWHGGGWHGGGYRGPRFYGGGPYYYGGYGAYAAYGGCYVRRLVPTPWGPRWRLVNRCY